MRYIIYGAGAIGGVVGGRLFAAGKDTVLICRGRHLEAIRDGGLLLRDPTGDRTLRVPTAGSPAELHFTDQDVVILTMKAQDTSAALDALEAAGGRDVAVVCCQNGVANERMAARRFDRVYAMLVALPATFMEPGVVIGWSAPVAGVLDIGRFPDGTDVLCDQVGADLGDAGFICRPDPAVMRLKYAKLLTNLGNGFDAISTLSRAGEPFRRIMHALTQEAIACFNAAGIAYTPREEYNAHVSRHTSWGEIPGAERGGSSTWQSLSKGSSRLEVDYLNGEIVLLGRLHGVPTPYNAAVRRLAQQLAAEGGKPGAYDADDVEALAARLGATANAPAD
ncbi:MAG TPA: 2-dehydropantoate 2-reductase N-terminal domain-containing protein [Dehalococcoidia bacterium]|nr:2-dehydropantoate 2-reductase N-terminal domain-containing protein [Dehalococcoidia bacterium]